MDLFISAIVTNDGDVIQQRKNEKWVQFETGVTRRHVSASAVIDAVYIFVSQKEEWPCCFELYLQKYISLNYHGIMGAFVKFSEQTSLHGFSFILNSAHWIHSVIYGIIIIIAIAMMIRDAIFLAEKYNSEPTRVELKIMANKTFDAGRPTLCLVPSTYNGNNFELLSWDYKFLMLNALGRESGRLEFTVGTNMTIQSLDNFLLLYNYNLSKITSEVSDLVNNTKFSKWYTLEKAQIFALLYQTVATIAAVESKLLSTKSTWISYIAKGETEYVRQYFIEKNVNFSQLIELMGMIDCRRTKLWFNNNDFCNTAEFTWWGFTDFSNPYDFGPKICYRFPTESFNFQFGGDYRNLSLTGITNSYNGQYSCHLFLDFSGRNAYYSAYSQTTAADLCTWEPQDIQIGVEYEIFSLNLVRKPCRDHDQLNCKVKCELDFYMSNCNCYPVTKMADVPKPDDMPYCASLPLINLSEELINVSTIEARRLVSCKSKDDVILQCKESCSQECRRRQVSFTYSNIARDKQASYKMAVNARLFMSSLTYYRFEESLMLTEFDVLVLDGGSIGFWLGGSLIAFAHVAIFFLGACITSIIERSRNKKTSLMTTQRDSNMKL